MLQEVRVIQKLVFVISTELLLAEKLDVVGAEENRLQIIFFVHFIYYKCDF